MRKSRLFYLLSFWLMIVLAGCGQEDGNQTGSGAGSAAADGGQEKTYTDDAYVPMAEFTKLSIPESALNFAEAGCFYGDGEIYYVDREYIESVQGEDEGHYESYLLAVATDGTDAIRTVAKGSGDAEIGFFYFDQEGSLYLYEYKSSYDDIVGKVIYTYSCLRKMGADGQEIYKVDLSEMMGDVYAIGVACYADRDGNVALLDSLGDQVFFVRSDGEYYARVQTAPTAVRKYGYNTNRMVYIKDQGYFLWYADLLENALKLWKVDFGKGLVAEQPVTIKMSSLGKATSTNDFVLFDGGEMGLLISTENVLWQYDLETGEKEEVFRWDVENVDLDGRLVAQIKWGAAGEGGTDMELLIFEDLAGVQYTNPMSVSIRYVDREQLPRRQTVTIGLDRYYGNIKNLVRRFNRSNGMYRAVLEEYNSGALKEMLMYGSAELPDLIEITGIRTEWLETKDLLVDLNPYLEKSSEISRENILPSVLELLEENGKLLSMATSFSIRSMITAADITETGNSVETDNSVETVNFMEGGWDYDRFLGLGEQYPESWYFDRYNAASVWGCISVTALDEFIDWKAGRCSFDSQEFKALIEKVKGLNYSVNQASGNRIELEKLISQQVLFQYVDYGSPYDYDEKLTETGGRIKSIGYPAMDGEPVYLFSPSQNLAIYAEASNRDGAWAFMEFLLSQGEQSWYSSANNVFPVRRDAFEAYLERGYSSFWQQKTWEHTPEELRYMVEHLGINRNDNEISIIISEELQAYFAGRKTADEVAGIIQNRVQLYLDEMPK